MLDWLKKFFGIWQLERRIEELENELSQKKFKRKASLKRAREALRKRKEERKGKILKEIEREGRITNNQVEKLLGVSDSTATRYLDELEKEGNIEQVGGARKDTYYRSKVQKYGSNRTV